jgi:hypothetical protein
MATALSCGEGGAHPVRQSLENTGQDAGVEDCHVLSLLVQCSAYNVRSRDCVLASVVHDFARLVLPVLCSEERATEALKLTQLQPV